MLFAIFLYLKYRTGEQSWNIFLFSLKMARKHKKVISMFYISNKQARKEAERGKNYIFMWWIQYLNSISILCVWQSMMVECRICMLEKKNIKFTSTPAPALDVMVVVMVAVLGSNLSAMLWHLSIMVEIKRERERGTEPPPAPINFYRWLSLSLSLCLAYWLPPLVSLSKYIFWTFFLDNFCWKFI